MSDFKYNYLKHIKEDVASYINHNMGVIGEYEDIQDCIDYLTLELQQSDYVTGSESGSYTHDPYQAIQCTRRNLDLFEDAAEEFGFNYDNIAEGGIESIDVAIRLHLVGRAVEEVLKENYAGCFSKNLRRRVMSKQGTYETNAYCPICDEPLFISSGFFGNLKCRLCGETFTRLDLYDENVCESDVFTIYIPIPQALWYSADRISDLVEDIQKKFNLRTGFTGFEKFDNDTTMFAIGFQTLKGEPFIPPVDSLNDLCEGIEDALNGGEIGDE